MVRLRAIEVADDQVRDATEEEKKQDHDDQPRYSEAPVGTPYECPANELTTAGTERTDVKRPLYSHARPLSVLAQNLTVRDRRVRRSLYKNPEVSGFAMDQTATSSVASTAKCGVIRSSHLG